LRLLATNQILEKAMDFFETLFLDCPMLALILRTTPPVRMFPSAFPILSQQPTNICDTLLYLTCVIYYTRLPKSTFISHLTHAYTTFTHIPMRFALIPHPSKRSSHKARAQVHCMPHARRMGIKWGYVSEIFDPLELLGFLGKGGCMF
jgi:hypothetical protein